MKFLTIQSEKNWTENALQSVEQIVLASRSPRRRELLQYIVKQFRVKSCSIREEEYFDECMQQHQSLPYIHRVEKATALLAKKKCLSFEEEKTLIIGADTTVVFNHQILNKPKSQKEAFDTIKMLCGNTHAVVTGVSLFLSPQCYLCFSVTSFVTFRKWSFLLEKKVTDYVERGISMDKAGSYGIQEEGSLFLQSLEGDFYNVVGFPVTAVFQQLEKSGLREEFF